MNLGTTRLRSRPRSRWQVEVREDGRIVGGEGWQENAGQGIVAFCTCQQNERMNDLGCYSGIVTARQCAVHPVVEANLCHFSHLYTT